MPPSPPAGCPQRSAPGTPPLEADRPAPDGDTRTLATGRLGGDLYAAVETRHGLRLLIADVRGSGSSAGGCADALLDAFHSAAGPAPSLPALADALELALLDRTAHHAGPAADEHFATALLAELSPDASTLTLLNHGHPAPLLLLPAAAGEAATGVPAAGSGGARTLHSPDPGLPLGLRQLATGRPPQPLCELAAGEAATHRPPLPPPAEERPADGGSVCALPFPQGATLLLLTDGTTEARDCAGAFYDPRARLAPHANSAPGELVRLLRRDVTDHAGGEPGDDMAVLAVRPVRHAPGPSCRTGDGAGRGVHWLTAAAPHPAG